MNKTIQDTCCKGQAILLVVARFVLGPAIVRGMRRGHRPDRYDIARCFSHRPHQVKPRGRASVPPIDGCHPPPVTTAVKRFKSEARKLWRAVHEIGHLENMQNARSRRNDCDRQLTGWPGRAQRLKTTVERDGEASKLKELKMHAH